jgi:hypothetical protein
MFNNLDNRDLLQCVFEERMSELKSCDAILTTLMDKHDFGAGFFHKILTKSVLKPGSLQAK